MYCAVSMVGVERRLNHIAVQRKSGSPKLATIGRALTLALIAALLLAAAHPVHGQTETILHSFHNNGTGGYFPEAGLVRDTKGNLYGTTVSGGTYGYGIVFELTPLGTETILHNFDENGTDGAYPDADLLMDTKGNLYSTTPQGGTYGNGTAFELTPSGTETILYSFGAYRADGIEPYSGLLRDTKGNFYGTTYSGGTYGYGTVFELTQSGTETILHTFDENGTDGYFPEAGLVRDTKGNLYGTTASGGTYGYGIVFELTPSGTETILQSFNEADGANPTGLVRDTEGNLYGTTVSGGAYGYGTVFKVTPSGTKTILHSFDKNGTDGIEPLAGLVLDTKGNLYGTTSYGGTYHHGTVFEVTPSGTETILHSFGESATDGTVPEADLVLDTKGNLYGTTYTGGSYGYGTVFKVTP